MVVLNRIYTRTGDDGTTSLGNDQRRKKYDPRVGAYGTIDELNAVIGVARLHTEADAQLDAMLARIQNDLFDLDADLASPDKAKGPGGERMSSSKSRSRGSKARSISSMTGCAPLRSFVLPGGIAGRGLSASRAHGVPPRRAGDGRIVATSRARAVSGGPDQICEPAVGFPVRRQPPCQ